MTNIRSAALVSSVLLLAGISPVWAVTLQWDLASDFRTYPDQSNPSPGAGGAPDVWHYMQSTSLDHSPDSYQYLEEFNPNVFGISGLEAWQNPDNFLPDNGLPAVGINASGVTKTYTSLIWPANVVLMHPYLDQMAIVGWKSPLTGSIDVNGSFGDMDPNGGNGVEWYIDMGNNSLTQGDINGDAASFSLFNLLVNKDDFLYFMVSSKDGDFGNDSTSLDLHISAIPLPAGFHLIASGLALLGLVGWKRRRAN